MNLRIALFCLLSGLCFTVSALGTGHFGWWYLSGIVIAASLVPVVRFGTRSLIGQWGTLALILVLIGLVCTISEAVVFFPEQKGQAMAIVMGGTVLYLLASTVMTLIARVLKLTEGEAQAVPRHSTGVAISMVLLAAISYLVYYEIFGGIVFTYFTKGYYPHAVEQVMAMGAWFYVYEIARGLLMTLGMLPVIYTLRLSRWQAAITVGMILWVVGGLGQLLPPNTVMTGTQRFIHVIEIFTQNFSLGVTAVLLLRPKKTAVAVPAPSVTAA